MKKISVYGSLLSELHNHSLLSQSNLLGEEIVEIKFEMISLGSFPGLLKSKDLNKVKIETYEVDDNTYKRVEFLEGFPSFYNKHKINTSFGESEVYFLEDQERYERDLVEKTNNIYDWKNYLNKKHEKYNRIR